MSSTNRDPSVASGSEPEPEPVDLASTTHFSLSRAVNSRKSEFVRSHRIRIKVGTWNVAARPGTDKDLASWFVDGRGVEAHFDSNLVRLKLSESDVADDDNSAKPTEESTHKREEGSHNKATSEGAGRTGEEHDQQAVRLVGGDKIGLYVLGLQEVVSLNLVQQSFYSDPSSIAKWQDALEAALPKGYSLVASQQLVGLLLLIYASPEVAETISNESTVATGTGLLGYMGNKGALTSRIILGETTRLVFSNVHLASGPDQASLDRRCWDYNKIMTQTKFAPVNYSGVAEDEEEKMGDEDVCFLFGDLNFRLDGLPADDIRRLLMLHTRGEYDINRKDTQERLGSEDGVIVLQNNAEDDPDGTKTPATVSRESSFDQGDDIEENTELPDPDDFMPDPHDDPASLQATLDSLLPHDQLARVIKESKAFHQAWREGPITFLPTYKYDVGTVGLFDSSEKQRAPSWCDRILYRTRKDLTNYEKKCKDEAEAKKRDEDMKKRGMEEAADDESVLFDYDPGTDTGAENSTSVDAAYDYDEYDDADEDGEQITTKEGFTDRVKLDLYASHQRIMSSDHKPLVAIFSLDYDAIVPELKAKVHAEVARDLDRAENEGRPGITIVVDGKDQSTTEDKEDKDTASGREGVDFGNVGFLQKETRSLTVANTSRVSATFSFVPKPDVETGQGQRFEWLHSRFASSSDKSDGSQQKEPLGDDVTLEPGDAVNAIIEVHVDTTKHVRALNEGTAQLEDVLVLRVTDGRDHFIPIRATWQPSCFGRSLEELIRIPRGGIRAFVKERQEGGSIPYNLEVHNSSPSELFKLTEAIETLTDRLIADENMLEDCQIPRDKAGWPFDEHSRRTGGDEDYGELRRSIIDALEEDRSVLETLQADVPTLKRLEVVGEVLPLFLGSMTDGIITSSLWARIEQSLPNVGNMAKTPAEVEEVKTAVLDILSSAPYYNISFVFLTSTLARVAGDLLPLNKEELEALNARRPPGALGRRSLSFRRSNAGSAAVDESAIQRRLAWERKAAEIFGISICRTSLPAAAKEKKAVEDKMRGVVEVFIRRNSA